MIVSADGHKTFFEALPKVNHWLIRVAWTVPISGLVQKRPARTSFYHTELILRLKGIISHPLSFLKVEPIGSVDKHANDR